jgi:curved DNA-binding protein CbpA
MSHYDTLGVNKNSSKEDIKRAYRDKAKECHPDKDPSKAEEFKEAAEAYRVLSNDALKLLYDHGHDTSQKDEYSIVKDSLASLFLKVVNDRQVDIVYTDIFALMKKLVEQTIHQTLRSKEGAKQTIKKFEKVQKRMKGRKDLFHSILVNQIGGLKAQQVKFDGELKQLNKMIELIEKCEYEVDQPPEQEQTAQFTFQVGGFTNTSTTGGF